MRHGSLFSGIGGFDLAAEWMGWENVFHCEWNPFGQKILHHYWPDAEQFNDITKTDFKKYYGTVDIISGGFPCQPYSSAGKRKGKDDERHLWPEMLRAIREIRPRWVVGENVLGLVNWSGGLVFHEVQADLEAQGYEVQPFLLPAAAVNAPHRRDRIWFVAYAESRRIDRKLTNDTSKTKENGLWNDEFNSSSSISITNPESNGQHECNGKNEINASERWVNAQCNIKPCNVYGDITNPTNKRQKYALENRELEGRRPRQPYKRDFWHAFPSQPPICGGNDGLSTKLDGITFSKWRAESIKGYGNAVVPQVVYQIFKSIQQYEQL